MIVAVHDFPTSRDVQATEKSQILTNQKTVPPGTNFSFPPKMGNGLNVRRVTAYQVRQDRKSHRKISVQKVKLDPKGPAVALTKRAVKRIKVMPAKQEAVLRALESKEEARDLIVNEHQLQALKSNPTANISLTKKQLKKLKSRARACGLIGTSMKMEE